MFNVKDKGLENHILSELDKLPPEWYDHNGNSVRAILTRRRDGYFKSLWWNTKDVAGDVKRALRDFNGDTSLSEILWLIAFIVLFPVVPFIREYCMVKNSVGEYKNQYLDKSSK